MGSLLVDIVENCVSDFSPNNEHSIGQGWKFVQQQEYQRDRLNIELIKSHLPLVRFSSSCSFDQIALDCMYVCHYCLFVVTRLVCRTKRLHRLNRRMSLIILDHWDLDKFLGVEWMQRRRRHVLKIPLNLTEKGNDSHSKSYISLLNVFFSRTR